MGQGAHHQRAVRVDAAGRVGPHASRTSRVAGRRLAQTDERAVPVSKATAAATDATTTTATTDTTTTITAAAAIRSKRQRGKRAANMRKRHLIIPPGARQAARRERPIRPAVASRRVQQQLWLWQRELCVGLLALIMH